MVGTYNGSHQKIYLDGTLINTSTSNIQSFDNAPMYFGNDSLAPARHFVGLMDEAGFWKKELNQTEITYLYNGGSPTTNHTMPFTDGVFPVNEIDFTFINQSPSDITNTNLFSQNLTIFYNVTKPNATNIYLNYTTINAGNFLEIINGSVTSSGYKQANYSTFSNNITSFTFFGHHVVYPVVDIGYNSSVYTNTASSRFSLNSSSDFLKTAIYNMSTITQNNVLAVMLNSTNSTVRIFYCNSSYTTGNPASSANCFHFATSANQSTFNHSHGANSAHNLFSFPINSTGFVGSVKVTSNGFFIFNAQSGTASSLNYITNTTRTDTTQYSTNNGNAYSNQAFTLNMALYTINSTDTFNYQICATNSTNTSCDTVRTDNLGITPFPPVIELDNPDTIDQNVSSRFLNISWSYLLTGATNINFSVFLLNSTNSVIKNLSFQGNTSFYNWDIPLSQIPTGTYKIMIFGNDSLGQNSSDIGEDFNLLNNAFINVSAKEYFNNATINTFNLSVLDLNTSEISLYNTTTGTIDVNTILNHTYEITADGSDYSYKIVNITQTNFTQNYTFFMNKTNSIYVQIFDSNTLQKINTSTTSITFVNPNSSTTVTTSNGTYLMINLTPSIYNVIINNSAYSITSFTVTLDSDTDQSLNAYLININTTQFIGFYIQDLSTQPVNATINVQKLINSSFATIANKQTDILGFTYFYLEQGVNYKFTITATGFQTKTFDLQPFTVNQPYIIRLDSSTSTPFVSIFDEVQYVLIPTDLNISTGNNVFQIHTSSPNGKILFTWINCTGAFQPTNSTGFPNGAVASIQVLGVTTGQTITCQYIISADGFEPASFYKYYRAGQQSSINNSTNLKSQMDGFITTYNKGWTTILAMLIIIGLASTLGFLTGNSTVVTFVVFAGIGFFAVFGWISKTIAFMTIAIVLLTYYLSSRVSG